MALSLSLSIAGYALAQKLWATRDTASAVNRQLKNLYLTTENLVKINDILGGDQSEIKVNDVLNSLREKLIAENKAAAKTGIANNTHLRKNHHKN